MNFSPGDLVIKNSGGNKMRIISYDRNEKKVRCGWFSETYNESIFNESDIVTISQWKNILKAEKRKDYLKSILEN